MSPLAAALLALVVAAAASVLLTPIAALVARRTGFLDNPAGYKAHGRATPYLGGTAVVLAFAIAAVPLDGELGRFDAIFACAAGLWIVGTVDDKIALAPRWRLGAEAAAGALLWSRDVGWPLLGSDILGLVLTVVWVVGVCNAVNLFDNMDGAAGTVVSVSGLSIGTIALLSDDRGLAVLCLALSGALAGFLVHNLARPPRIFLGDGGSLPIGLLIAALAMRAAHDTGVGDASVLVGALAVGLPILDTALVSLSRTRRRVSLMTPGRDHLTHRLLARLQTPQRVAVVLCGAQAFLGGLAVLGTQLGTWATATLAAIAATGGLIAVVILDSPGWRPSGVAYRDGLTGSEPAAEGASDRP